MSEETNIIKQKKPRIPGKRTLITVSLSPFDTIEIKEEIIHKIADIAHELNVNLFLVGGYIRDYFLKKKRKDLDFTVIGDSIAFARELAIRFKTKAVIFERFRTAQLNIGEFQCEFVGTRKEIYNPESRKPDVVEGTLDDDIRRRDFTINSMASSLSKDNFGKLIDIFNGRRDLESRLLKTPLDPITTFNDDPLRMLRAARFASQLDFRIDEQAINAIKRITNRIEIISQERISDEFLKIINSEKPSIGLKILFETGLLDIIFPELNRLAGIEIVHNGNAEFAHKDIFLHSLQVIDKVAENSKNIWLRFAALVHDIAKPNTKRFNKDTGWTFHGHEEIGAKMMEKIFRKFKFPLENLPYVEKLVRLHQRPMALVDDGVTDSAVRRLAFHAGDALQDLFTLCRSDITTKNPNLSSQYLQNYDKVTQKVIEVQEKDKLREFQSPVRGEEIMSVCKLKPSKAVGYIKNAIEEAILDGIIPNEYLAARKFFIRNKSQWLKKIKEMKE